MRWCLALLLIIGCTPKDQSTAIVIWEDGKAVAVSLLKNDSIYVAGSPYAVLGEVSGVDGRFVFTPAIPFQRGQSYHTSTGISFAIPVDTTRRAPKLLGSFPSCDTVPSNLLKIYLQFSEPMSEGRSYQYIQLYDVTAGDTVNNAFLDLQPELWNEDGTALTLWLDPGRIKQDLVPNRKLGVVMNDDRKYRLSVASGWRSKNGLPVEDDYSRTFVTSKRDVKMPVTDKWTISFKGDTVVVDLKESFDWSLLHSTFSIVSGESEVPTQAITNPCENQLYLVPHDKLQAGDYRLAIQSRLEDLAGNSLNRLFETDVTTSSGNPGTRAVYSIKFRVD